jgi:hypothetical protein
VQKRQREDSSILIEADEGEHRGAEGRSREGSIVAEEGKQR